MRRKKEAPAGRTAAGRRLTSIESYPNTPGLSTAVQILLLALQSPDHADRLRAACWRKLESTLRRHYAERGQG